MSWIFLLIMFYGICAIILLMELRRTPGYGDQIRYEGRVYEVFQTGSKVVKCSDYHQTEPRTDERNSLSFPTCSSSKRSLFSLDTCPQTCIPSKLLRKYPTVKDHTPTSTVPA